jgi:hypothetical protein
MFWAWVVHTMGVDFMAPYGHWVWYNFWSGFGSLTLLTTCLATPLLLYRKHNCHVAGCWRIGRHKVSGTEYVVCRRHHPNGAPTHEDVLREYEEASK